MLALCLSVTIARAQQPQTPEQREKQLLEYVDNRTRGHQMMSEAQGLCDPGVGRAGEPYEGIGRGLLNIEGLPVYRDAEGGVGTPTSDHERTKMTIDTRHLVVLINGYDGNEQRVRENAAYIQELLRKYCQSDGGHYDVYR